MVKKNMKDMTTKESILVLNEKLDGHISNEGKWQDSITNKLSSIETTLNKSVKNTAINDTKIKNLEVEVQGIKNKAWAAMISAIGGLLAGVIALVRSGFKGG